MNKPIAVTLVVLVLLVLVYFFGGSPDSENVPEETAGLKAFQEMNLDEVAKIVIAKGKAEPVELVKRDGTWYVASRWDFEADPERIEKILGGLRKIESPALVGERDASHPDFEVNDIKGGFLTLFDREGKKLSRLVIGKTAPSANFRVTDVFVRFGDDKETFRVRSDIRGDANLYSSDVEAKRYLNTKLFELDEGSEIVSVRIQRAGEDDLLVERRSRVKKEETSEKDGAEEKDEAKDETKKEPEPEEYFVVTQAAETHEVIEKKWAARGILDRAKSIRFEDAVEPKDPSEYGLDKPQLKVIISYRKKDVEGAAINELKLSFGNAIKDEKGEDKAYYFLFEGPGSKGRITTVEKWDFSGWNKQLKEFLPEPKKEETEDEKAEPEDAKEAADSPEDPAPGEPAGPGVDPAKEPAPESANAPVSEPSGEPAEPVKEAGPGATGSPAPVSEPSGEPAESAESAE